MQFLVVLAVTAAVCCVLAKSIHRNAAVLYGIVIALCAAFIASLYVDMPRPVWGVLFLLMQECTLSLALFVIVMFIGAFPRGSYVDRTLRPIRAELSIAACFLAAGHMAMYLAAYLPRVVGGGVFAGATGPSIAIALVLLALLLALGVTSFKAVKSRMSTDAWRKLQRWAYLFYGLVWVHLMLMLAPAALAGSSAALADCAIYTAVFGTYAIMRVYRWRKDAAPATSSPADPITDLAA